MCKKRRKNCRKNGWKPEESRKKVKRGGKPSVCGREGGGGKRKKGNCLIESFFGPLFSSTLKDFLQGVCGWCGWKEKRERNLRRRRIWGESFYPFPPPTHCLERVLKAPRTNPTISTIFLTKLGRFDCLFLCFGSH